MSQEPTPPRAAAHEPTWRSYPVAQQPTWPDLDALSAVTAELTTQPPLVFTGECRALSSQLAAAQAGRAFVLQAGDCAESFDDHSADTIRDNLKVILQMALVLTYATGVPVIKIGRMAGQFAKPRSSDTQTVHTPQGDLVIPAFRGHIVNSELPDPVSRRPDPDRLLAAYHQSATTLNLIRAFTKGGFADLAQLSAWNRQFVADSPQGSRYEQLAKDVTRALHFMEAAGIHVPDQYTLHQVDFYTSHEALILEYEQALTRCDSLTGDYYDCSAHQLWIGERTRQIDGAHVEFARTIANPVAVKLGPSATRDDVIALCELLNPQKVPGRLTLIARLGADQVTEHLPALIEAARLGQHPVLWMCDPMHANTTTAPSGHKTRHFDDVLTELRGYLAVHDELGTWPGGVHIELTGAPVTECLGGDSATTHDDLPTNYQTICDPRLNARQSLDLAFTIAGDLQ
jgi:3-deoxy-7-phosphoheptulonate synthase